MEKPFHTITAAKDVPLFVFGDHASKYIPEEYDNLGLSGGDLTRHIAWDIGTGVIVRHLCAHFGAAGQLAGISRLVIDYNRDTNMPSSIPVDSDGTVISGNQDLSEAQRRARVDRFHTPYHAALNEALEVIQSSYDDPLVVSIHSFTSKPNLGDYRDLDIGLLVKDDEVSASALHDLIGRLYPAYSVAVNEPYSAYVLNYTIDISVSARGLRHLAIEVNQDLVDTNEKALKVAKALAECLAPIIYQPSTLND